MTGCPSSARGRRAVALLQACVAVALIAGCGTTRPPAPAELEPLAPARHAGDALPDDVERAAGRLAALALADLPDAAAQALGLLRDVDARRRADARAPTGLVDLAEETVRAIAGSGEQARRAPGLLERDTLDPALRRRAERALEREPLTVAERALRDHRQLRRGAIFNRLAAPLARAALGGGLNPIETGRSLLSSLLTLHHFPVASTRERRALRAYEAFLAREPAAPEAPRVREQVEELRARVTRHRHEAAVEAGERALGRGAWNAALLYAARAERIHPGDARNASLEQGALAGAATRDARIRAALRARADVAELRDPVRHALAVDMLVGTPGSLAARLDDPRVQGRTDPGARALLRAVVASATGRDAERIEALERAAGSGEPFARHATAVLRQPDQDPYGAYRRARSGERSARTRWLLLGRLARGASERDLPRPVEYLIDVPTFAVSLITLPLRALQYGRATRFMGAGVLAAGERYVRRHPDGAHSPRIHRDLERRYASAGLWASALEHGRARGAGERTLARYHALLADALLEVARRERRPEMRAAVYGSILSDHPDTPAAATARERLAALFDETSPQSIRLSREFLLEHPRIREVDTLALRPELLDGEARNGEVAEEGVMLIGRTWVRVSLEGREPVIRELPAANFALLAALLEESRYRALVADERESPEHDPQRDLFLERARLGLLDRADHRPAARSHAEFLSARERLGTVRARESVLPVEVVVRGDLETLGLSAVPRLRLPEPAADAFLYE